MSLDCFYRFRLAAVGVALAVLATSGAVTPAQAQTSVKVKPLYGKVESSITALYNGFSAAKRTRSPFSSSSVLGSSGIQTTSTSVVAEIAVTGTVATVRAQLVALGVTITGEYGPHFDVVLPFALIDDVALLPQVAYVAPNYGAKTNAGATTSQGDKAERSDILRSNASVDGTGQKVGVLSDSFDKLGSSTTSYSKDIASGDLPAGVDVVQDYSGKGTDEGRAMLQIVHDVAPGANLAFATGNNGEAAMAANIQKLRAAGCTVITDDIGYYAAPFFRDGLIAQSVDQCVKAGVPYTTSAGNDGHVSYEGTFTSSTQRTIGGKTGDSHDFDPGSGVDDLQKFTIPAYASVRLVFQWDDQWKSLNPTGSGAQNDFDFFLTDSTGATVLKSSVSSNVGGNPVEQILYYNSSSSALVCNLVILRVAGTATPRIKYVEASGSGATINEYATNSSTSYGHANAAGAFTLGAAYFGKTPVYGQTPALLEYYSSRCGTPILRDTNGNSIGQVVRPKPDVVAPDGVNTTFFGYDPTDFGYASDGDSYPNFFGTSAAAPHAAAVAALLLQAHPGLTPDRLYGAMRTTALDMGTAGFDYDTGYGLLDAEAALGSLKSSQSGPGFVVTNTTDTGDGLCDAAGTYDGCSLREAVSAANLYNANNSNAGATITFDTATFGSSKQTIALGGTALSSITGPTTITGPATSSAGVSISGNDQSSIASVVSAGSLALNNLTLTRAKGAALYNQGTLNINSCTFSANTSGGALYNQSGTLNIGNSTFSGNSSLDGGALHNVGSTTIDSSTFVGNSASGSGGALYLERGSLKLTNSIVVGNTASGGEPGDNGPNIYGNVSSDSDTNLVGDTTSTTLPGTHNIVGRDAVLGDLADNGGPTQTRALLGGSPAINAGSTALTLDQRSIARDSAPDMGAYEFVNVAPTVDSITPSSSTSQVGDTQTFTVTVSDGNGVGDIKEVWFMANTKIDWSDGATLAYLPASNQLYLRDGDHFAAPITPGSGTLSNSAVSIDGATVNVSTAGNSLTLSFTLQTKNGMVGANKLWGRVQDQSGAVDPAAPAGDFGNVQKGTWTVNGSSGTQAAPSAAINPGAKGTSTPLSVGSEFNLTLELTDPNGEGDLQSGEVIVNAAGHLTWTNGFALTYDARNHRLYLRSTDGSTFLGGQVVGQGTGTLENEAVSIRLDGCTVTSIANGVRLVLPVTPKAAFAGSKQVWSRVEDTAGNVAVDSDANFGFKTEGTLVITNAQDSPPQASVQVAGTAAGKGTSHTLASGAETTFTLNLSDADGAGQLDSGWILINAPGNLDWGGGITLVLDAREDVLYLRSSDGTQWYGSPVGSPSGTLDNDAVSVRLSGCTVARTATGVSLTVTLTPKVAFAGTRQIWSRVQDTAGNVQANNDDRLGFNTEGQLNITASGGTASVTATKPSGGAS